MGLRHPVHILLRVDFLLKTDSGYPKDTGVRLFTLCRACNDKIRDQRARKLDFQVRLPSATLHRGL